MSAIDREVALYVHSSLAQSYPECRHYLTIFMAYFAKFIVVPRKNCIRSIRDLDYYVLKYIILIIIFLISKYAYFDQQKTVSLVMMCLCCMMYTG